MKTQQDFNKEFNRLYGNLKELFRRIHDQENNYPKRICANWFVNTLAEIMQNPEVKVYLTHEQVNSIAFMALNLVKTEFLNEEDKETLQSLLQNLKNAENNITV